jgi:hypothetical protein
MKTPPLREVILGIVADSAWLGGQERVSDAISKLCGVGTVQEIKGQADARPRGCTPGQSAGRATVPGERQSVK